MSLRRPAEAEPAAATDGRSYRRAFQYYQNERRKEQERRQREANERRVVAPPTPSTPPPPPTPTPANPRTNPWTAESATQLWVQLVANSPTVDVDGAFTLPQFIKALDAGGVGLRTAFQFPFPNVRVQSTETRNPNSDYATKLWNLVADQGARPFDRDALVAYLATPLIDPLTRVRLTTAARASGRNDLPSLARLR